jgi:hypothetical protein
MGNTFPNSAFTEFFCGGYPLLHHNQTYIKKMFPTKGINFLVSKVPPDFRITLTTTSYSQSSLRMS